MANNDQLSTVSTELTGSAVQPLESPTNAVLFSGESAASNLASNLASSSTSSDVKGSAANSLEDHSSSHSTRPVLVQLGSSATTQSSSAAPKRYSAFNINKKFLEKNTSASTSLPTSSSSNSVKPGGTPTRPAVQSSSSHPRLVTTKLTAPPQSSSTPGPGWSRPSSVTPPVASTPNGMSNLAPTPSQAAAVSVPAAPQLPHAGKVIQPQPRSIGQLSAFQKDGGISGGGGSTKPVWGNVKPAAGTTRADVRVQSDFPTAAEVAQGSIPRNGKSAESKESEAAEANKQARLEEADTFRGVHLDPNAHHWDEMEEDDDNFLDGVIEFGDGRQYKIDTNKAPASPPTNLPPQDGARENLPKDSAPASGPVSKEERFVDDFDRSWPRSKGSPSAYAHDFTPSVLGQRPNSVGQASSPVSSSASPALSPQESSRVLFNERSNKLEPYSSTSHRPGAGPYPLKRGHHPDHPTIESRAVRDLPSGQPHGVNNIQLLQKPSRGNLGGFGPPERQKDRDGVATFSPRSDLNSLPPVSKDRDSIPERGRHQSNMGPPPVPPHAARSSNFRDGGRQLPPHLSQVPPHTGAPVEHRQSSRDSRYQQSARPPSSGRSSIRHPSQSPVLSHAAVTSPLIETGSIPLSAAELEDVKKDLMHTAAARAKQRRQQEEEEREREKERARRKAAEIEERMEAKKKPEVTQSVAQPKQAQDEIIPSVNGASSEHEEPQPQVEPNTTLASIKPSLRRPPSLKGSPFQPHDISRPPFARRTSVSSSANTSANPSAAESWRIKSTPLPTSRPPQTRSRASSTAHRSPAPLLTLPSTLDQVESLAENTADLEVIDYSELDKFVGVTEVPENAPAETPSSQPKTGRPVASDFFDEELPTAEASSPARSSVGVLGRSIPDLTPSGRESASATSTIVEDTSTVASNPDGGNKRVPDVVVSAPPADTFLDHSHPTTAYSAASRSGRNQGHYKEATMSALDDAMSRIKGVLDVMHEKDHVPPSEPDHSPKWTSTALTSSTTRPPSQRWIPPALRERNVPPQPQEHFLSTCAEPPRSPTPAWNAFTVRLPKTSVVREPVSKQQIAMFNKPQPARWEILSFTPHVEGMKLRDFSLNEVLFRKPYSYKGKMRYRVSLPKKSLGNVPRFNTLPSRPAAGAFGKPTAADGAPTWRKSPSIAPTNVDGSSAPGRDTTSKSPPPESDGISRARQGEEVLRSDDSTLTLVRSRSQPKMPAGSGVAFYRDSRVVDIRSESNPSVSFFATNDLEVVSAKAPQQDAQSDAPASSSPSAVSNASPDGEKFGTVRPSPIKNSPSSPHYVLPSLIQSTKSESKSSEDSPDRVPITPPSHHAAPWARTSLALSLKESPVRGPDPEHLKAVWSQTSNKADLPAINSLEGIMDDLTSLPFTLQDVKSEDGETPPPMTSAAPSRMSLHDVTRAFQQVPSSSNLPPHKPTISPPSTTAPVARPTQNYGYHAPVQPPNSNVRPSYPYASPLLSHSPAPGTVYPHSSPIPSRMQAVNGHTQLYSPVWVPVPNPNNQNPGNVMRHMASPYPPPQMMHYPLPGTQTMYGMPPTMQSPQMQNGTPNRNRTLPMMSPVMSHSVAVPPMPLYASTMMLPAHAGRGGTVRNDGSHTALAQHPPQPSAHSHQPQTYASLPTASFNGVRPTW